MVMMMMGTGGWRRLMMRWFSRPFVVVVVAIVVGMEWDVYDIKTRQESEMADTKKSSIESSIYDTISLHLIQS